MSVFAYDPDAAKSWANGVINYLNGGNESVRAVSKKFNEQIEKLVQPNVWTGTAAAKNYQNFMDTHTALINFVNSFGEAFEKAMNSLNTGVGLLEEANLGSASATASFGTLSYDQIMALSEENVNIDIIRYDYATITSIGAELNNISQILEDVNKALTVKINELNSGASIWDGNAAEEAKNNLTNSLVTNMGNVMENLNVCIANIASAAEEAQKVDSGM